MDPDKQKLEEMYRLSKDNNRMLHAMRRNAFWGGVIKVLIYGALLVGPVWFYYAYMSETVNKMMATMSEIQGTGAKVGSSRVDLQACKLEYSIVSPK